MIIVISFQFGIAQQFEYKLPREPNKYSKGVVSVDVYEQRIENFDTLNFNPEHEIVTSPKYRMTFNDGLLKSHFTGEVNREMIYDYNLEGNLSSRITESDNYREEIKYSYDFENMKLEAIRNDTQIYFIKFFDENSKVIEERNSDVYTSKKRNTKRKFFFDKDKLKLEEFYENGVLKFISYYFRDSLTSIETVIIFDKSGELIGKRINEFNDSDLITETMLDENGKEKYRFKNVFGNFIL